MHLALLSSPCPYGDPAHSAFFIDSMVAASQAADLSYSGNWPEDRKLWASLTNLASACLNNIL